MSFPDIFGAIAAGRVQKAKTKVRIKKALEPFILATVLLSTFGAAGMLYFEYELSNRVFANITGDNNPYFTPAIMGLSAVIVVGAMYFLHQQRQDSSVVSFLAKATSVLVRIYAVGFGLMVVLLLLSAGGLTDFISSQSVTVYLEDLDDMQPHWLEQIMGDWVSPVGGLLFSCAVGGLAVLNLYTSHQAMQFAISSIKRVSAIRNEYQTVMADANVFTQARKNWLTTDNERNTLLGKDDELRHEVASDALLAIQYAVKDALKKQRENLVSGQQFSLLAAPQPNLTETDEAIAQLRAITLTTLVKHTK